MKRVGLLYSGKAKSVFLTDDKSKLLIEFRNDTSAFDGEKVAQLDRKGAVNNRVNAFIMQYLEREGIAIDARDPARLVLFPEMDEEKDIAEITTECWGILGKSPSDIMCASSRMVVHRKGTRYVTGLAYHPVKSGCMPSVDPMFDTVAEAFDGHVAGILLSGMGRDGTEGADSIIGAGGSIYAQNADSCAVWGMPRDVTERGLATAVLPPAELADKVLASAGADAWR